MSNRRGKSETVSLTATARSVAVTLHDRILTTRHNKKQPIWLAMNVASRTSRTYEAGTAEPHRRFRMFRQSRRTSGRKGKGRIGARGLEWTVADAISLGETGFLGEVIALPRGMGRHAAPNRRSS